MNSVISKEDIAQLIRRRVTADPRFKDANVRIEVDGSIIRIKIVAYGAFGTSVIPVEFKVRV